MESKLTNEQLYAMSLVCRNLIQQEIEGITVYKIAKLSKQLDELTEPIFIAMNKTNDKDKRWEILAEEQEANLIKLNQEDLDRLTLRPMDLLALEPILEGVNEFADFE